MRSKRLRKHNASIIQSMREPEKTKRFPWGKVIYLFLLSFLIFKGLGWIYRQSVFIEGIGYVTSPEFYVEARMAGTIIKILPEENDLVQTGDPLVFLEGYTFESGSGGTSSSAQATLRRRVVEAENALYLIRKEIQLKSDELKSLQEEKRRATGLLNSGAISLSQFKTIALNQEECNNAVILLRTKENAAQRLLNSAQIELTQIAPHYYSSKYRFTHPDSFKNWPEDRIMRAPATGKIVHILKYPGQIAQVGDPVLRIAQTDSFAVKAYFDVAAEGEFHVGDQVRVAFQNGDRILGIIRKIYIGAEATPHVFRGQFAAPKNKIVAEIETSSLSEEEHIISTQVAVYIKRQFF